MLHRIRQIIKSRVAVHFVIGRIEKGFRIFRGGVDMRRFHHPDTDAFVTTGIHVAGIFDGHLRVGGVEATHVFVAQALFGADEYFPEGPIVHRSGELMGLYENGNF